MIRSFRIGLALAATISSVCAQTPTPAAATGTARIALVSTAETADLAALLTTELSSHAGVALVERDALAKIGEERKVQSMADTDAVALGKLVNADGLLFLNKENDQIRIRLTAVGLGYAVFDSRIASNTDTTQLAKTVAHEIAEFSPKLLLPPGKATPISLLNLRSDLATTNSTKTERDLTLLLESRLASVPEYLVLERRHAWDLGFEHSLGSSTPPLLEGAYVLDGVLRISGPNNEDVHAQIRVRTPKSSEEKTVEADGNANDLSALSEMLATRINRAIGAPISNAAWQPQDEAREYLGEGIWAWEHGQPQAAIEALDSAELLGEQAPDLLAARIQALCQVTVPDFNPFLIQFICDENSLLVIFEVHSIPTHYFNPLQPLPDRLADARRAISDIALYARVASQPLKILDPKWQHEVQLGSSRHFVIHAASSVQDPALARYDWDSGNLTILAAARRRPPQNQFDDRRGYQVLNIFPSLNQTLGTSIDFGCYTASEKPGPWPEVISGIDGGRAVPCGSRAVITDYRDKLLFLVDPAQSQPSLLLSQPGASLPADVASFGPARWQVDATTIIHTFRGQMGVHGDALVSFIRHQTVPNHFELLWYDPHQKAPISIPLKFEMDPAFQSKVRTLPGMLNNYSTRDSAIHPELDIFPLQAVYTDSGICLWHPSNGVWFIPYTEIELYLKNLHH